MITRVARILLIAKTEENGSFQCVMRNSECGILRVALLKHIVQNGEREEGGDFPMRNAEFVMRNDGK